MFLVHLVYEQSQNRTAHWYLDQRQLHHPLIVFALIAQVDVAVLVVELVFQDLA